MNNRGSYVLELFRECNKDENFEEFGSEVNVGFQEHGDTLLILFEPSDGRVDWRHNFAFFKKPYDDMEIEYYVHGGFLKCWKQVKDLVRAKLKEKKWKYVVIVGYSHGAALALLAHECAWFELPDMRDGCIITVAFEAPRIYGGWRVKEELKERWAGAYVIKNNGDIVTHMPPRLFGFSDVGKVMQIKNTPKKGCVDSHTPKWIQKALLEKEIDELESVLKATNLWKDNACA